jgi:hypothetical protein
MRRPEPTDLAVTVLMDVVRRFSTPAGVLGEQWLSEDEGRLREGEPGGQRRERPLAASG